MFGYVKPNKQELLVKDYETYRAVYCGLCKTLGKRYSVFSRFALNYDYTFLAVVVMSVSDEVPVFANEGCLFNPLSRKRCCKRCVSLDHAADALILTTYFKLSDAVRDSGFFKSLAYRFVRGLCKPMMRKAKKHCPEVYELLEEYVSAQGDVEERESVSLDAAAEPTAKFMSELLSFKATADDERRVTSVLGYNIGKWIYILDAVDDFEKDRKIGSFNPLMQTYKFSENGGEDMSMMISETGKVLDACVLEAAKAVDLLDSHKFEMIIKNVVYVGMPAEQARVFSKLKAKEGI